jgi:hypothetical protein
MSPTKRLLHLLSSVLVACVVAVPAYAQEAQLFATNLVSSHPVLDASAGAGISLSLTVIDWLAIGGGVSQVRSTTSRDGVVCLPIPGRRVGCGAERVRDEVTISSLHLGVHPFVETANGLRAGLGTGISISELRGASYGETSDLSGNLYIPPTAQLGGFLRLELSYVPWRRVPLGIVMNGVGTWTHFDGCRSDEHHHQAFCGGESFGELQAGLTYRFGR